MKTDWANKEWLKNKNNRLTKLDILSLLIFAATVVYLIDWFIEELVK